MSKGKTKAKDGRLTRIALRLVQAHYSGDEDAFKSASVDLARLCDERGDYELAEHVMAQYAPAFAFRPM